MSRICTDGTICLLKYGDCWFNIFILCIYNASYYLLSFDTSFDSEKRHALGDVMSLNLYNLMLA